MIAEERDYCPRNGKILTLGKAVQDPQKQNHNNCNCKEKESQGLINIDLENHRELIEMFKMKTSPEIIDDLNGILQVLKSRNHLILDFENPDCRLDHIEYHKAEDINGEKSGDGSDNLYCFFRGVASSDK